MMGGFWSCRKATPAATPAPSATRVIHGSVARVVRSSSPRSEPAVPSSMTSHGWGPRTTAYTAKTWGWRRFDRNSTSRAKDGSTPDTSPPLEPRLSRRRPGAAAAAAGGAGGAPRVRGRAAARPSPRSESTRAGVAAVPLLVRSDVGARRWAPQPPPGAKPSPPSVTAAADADALAHEDRAAADDDAADGAPPAEVEAERPKPRSKTFTATPEPRQVAL